MRVLVADDDVHVVSALHLLLEDEPDLTIVGDCSAADGLVDQVLATQPSVVLLDWDLPGLRSSDALQRLLSLCPGCHLLALSGRPEHRCEALRAGARAFVCKGDAPEALLAALRSLPVGAEGERRAADQQPGGRG